MKFARSLFTGSVLLFTLPVFLFSPRQTNTPPVIQINFPVEGIVLKPGALVPYSVSVSDREDGESKFEEIPPVEIFMELRYFADAAKAAAFKNAKDPAGYRLFKKGDCYNCHAVRSKVIGPAFADIAAKYRKPGDLPLIAGHILKGSTGIWGTAIMPTHPDLTASDAQLIVRWMLQTGKDSSVDYFRGAEGAFHLPPVKSPAKGIFLLKASYTDHGTDKAGAGALTGQDIRKLKPGN